MTLSKTKNKNQTEKHKRTSPLRFVFPAAFRYVKSEVRPDFAHVLASVIGIEPTADRLGGYICPGRRVCKIPKMRILRHFRRLLAVFRIIFTSFNYFYSVQKPKATKKVTKFGDLRIKHYLILL